jgi:energy-coupling factor transport system permease protein
MNAIKSFHPAVGFSFFMLMIVLSLTSMQPVFQIISFVAVVCYAIAVSGPGAFLRGNWWIIILVAVVILFNGFFGGRGLTVLFSLNLGFMQTPVTVESLVYGVCMGLMLANVILWFNVLGKLSSMQGFIELFTRVSPTLGMMIARITVFIPELLAQARLVEKAQRVFVRSSVGGGPSAKAEQEKSKVGRTPLHEPPAPLPHPKRTRKEQLAYGGIMSSYLMEWGMEKSLITAQSMVARGYGSRKRTSFRRTHLTLRDLVPLVTLLVLGLASLVCIVMGSMAYQFYPHLSPLEVWWGYTPFLLLILVPPALQLSEELAWWRST